MLNRLIGFEKGGIIRDQVKLAKGLGTSHLIVLVNKMDENRTNWSQERYEYIKTQLYPFLKDSCGYDIEHNVHWFPISALQGDNIMNGINDARGSWYKGPTFFDMLDNLPIPHGDPEGPVRIPILDKFRDGNVLRIFGKVESGTTIYSKILL